MQLKRCPLLNKECIAEKCMWWVEILMKNTQTQETYMDKNCAISRLPMMFVELLKNTNGVQRAVESHRNADIRLKSNLLQMVDGGLNHANPEG